MSPHSPPATTQAGTRDVNGESQHAAPAPRFQGLPATNVIICRADAAVATNEIL